MRNEHESCRNRGSIPRLTGQRGFTLIELVVVLGIFTIVIIMATTAFDRLLSSGTRESSSATSQIEGVVGLEMLRRDISHAGYGLPWSFQTPPASVFPEVSEDPADDTGTVATSFNETVPHAISCAAAGPGGTNPGTDYLVLKSALLPLRTTNSTAGRWGYLNYATSALGVPASYVKMAGDAESDLRANDRAVIIATSISGTGAQNRELLNSGTGVDAASFSFSLSAPDFLAPAALQPTDSSRTYLVYGVSDVAPKMPYNRADYYVMRPPANDPDFKIPSSCNAGPNGTTGTGILFKAVADHSGGYATPYPLLNCVGDMKVIYTLDRLGDGNLSYFPATSNVVTALTPQQLRAQLRSVTVYILTHEGRRDSSYTYPSDTVFLGPTVGATPLASVGRTWTAAQLAAQFGADWRNYRWKVYSFTVSPRNMQD